MTTMRQKDRLIYFLYGEQADQWFDFRLGQAKFITKKVRIYSFYVDVLQLKGTVRSLYRVVDRWALKQVAA